MTGHTNHYNLEIPSETEFYDVNVSNVNMTKIDQALAAAQTQANKGVSDAAVAQATANVAAKIEDLMVIWRRGYQNDANNIQNGVTYCNVNTPNMSYCFVWQIQYNDSDMLQLAIPGNGSSGCIAFRSLHSGAWIAWQEMMPKTGGVFSGYIAAPRLVSGSVETDTYFYVLANAGMRVANKANTGFAQVTASAFNVNSSKSVKTDITEYAGALEKINSAKIYKYTRTDDGAQQIGLITEDVTTPAELKHEIEKPNGNGEKPRARAAAKPEMTETIDLYSFISLVSQAVKELKAEKDAEIEVLKSKITALEGK